MASPPTRPVATTSVAIPPHLRRKQAVDVPELPEPIARLSRPVKVNGLPEAFARLARLAKVDELPEAITQLTCHVAQNSVSVIAKDKDHASDKVFVDTELLEAILVAVNPDLREIFRLRRVCKKWKVVIEHSKTLHLPITSSPRLGKALQPTWTGAFVDEKLLDALILKTGCAGIPQLSRSDAAWKRPDAFWRTISLFTPPANTASVQVFVYEKPHLLEKWATCTNRSGVTLGDLWGAILRALGMPAGGNGRAGRCEVDSVVITSTTHGTFRWEAGVTSTEAGTMFYASKVVT